MGKSTKPIEPAKCEKIIADYAECRNCREVGRRHSVSPNTVKAIVQRNPESAQLCAQKAEEQTQDAIAYLNSRNAKMYILVDKLIDAMTEKACDVDMFTNIRDLAVTFGTAVDKLIKLHEISGGSNDDGVVRIVDDIK